MKKYIAHRRPDLKTKSLCLFNESGNIHATSAVYVASDFD